MVATAMTNISVSRALLPSASADALTSTSCRLLAKFSTSAIALSSHGTKLSSYTLGMTHNAGKSLVSTAAVVSPVDLNARRPEVETAIDEAMGNCITETYLNDRIPSLGPKIRGKVRDIFEAGDDMVLVTTDRQSTFDRVLASVPFTGQVKC